MKSVIVMLGSCAAVLVPSSALGQSTVAAGAEASELEAAAESRAQEKPRRFYFRLGGTHIATLESSRELKLANVDGAASLAVEDGPIAGSGSSVSSATVFSAVVGYVLPVADRKIAIELVLGAPFTIKFSATGTLASESIAPEALGIPTGVPALGSELGETKAAPVVVTAVYSTPHVGPVRPLVGGGLSLLLTRGAKITNEVLSEVRQPDFDIKPSPGLVLQGGAETKVWKRVYARLEAKFIAFSLARAEVKNIAVRTPDLPLFDQAEVGTAKMDVWINPLIITAGVGMDF